MTQVKHERIGIGTKLGKDAWTRCAIRPAMKAASCVSGMTCMCAKVIAGSANRLPAELRRR